MKLIKNINIKFIVVVAVASTLLLIFFIKFTKEDPLLKEAESFRAKKMPKMLLQDAETGIDYSDEIMRGEVFLVYSISSCDACRKELKFFSQAKTDSKSTTKIIAVMPEDKQVVRDYIKQNEIKIPILIDKDGKLLQELNLKYFPSNFKLINGEIKRVSFGLPQDTKDLMEQVAY